MRQSPNVVEARLSFDGDARAEVRGNSSDEVVGYLLDDNRFVHGIGRSLEPHCADLLDIAAAVYVADRVVRRRGGSSDRYELQWKRRLCLQVPVRLRTQWEKPSVRSSLLQSLRYLTGDDWIVDFVDRKRPRRNTERQGHLFGSEGEGYEAALFSGGLDSFAGAVADLRSDKAGLILISTQSNARLGRVIATLVHRMEVVFASRVRSIVLPLSLKQDKWRYNTNERSQRTRGFLYGVIGAVAGRLAKCSGLTVYENGIGAINLPYSPVQFGPHSTRSINPVALAYLQKFIESLLEQTYEIRLPNLFRTKSELCEGLRGSGLEGLAAETATCDSFPLRHKHAVQCGTCSSCLLRRQSLWACGLSAVDQATPYFYDVVGKPSQLTEKRWLMLGEMLGQVQTVRKALYSSNPWAALSGEYPVLRKVLWVLEDSGNFSNCDVPNELVRVFTLYCDEWDRFPAKPPGWNGGVTTSTADWRFRHAS